MKNEAAVEEPKKKRDLQTITHQPPFLIHLSPKISRVIRPSESVKAKKDPLLFKRKMGPTN